MIGDSFFFMADLVGLFMLYFFIGMVYNAWAISRMVSTPLPSAKITLLWPLWIVAELGYGIYRIGSLLRAYSEGDDA